MFFRYVFPIYFISCFILNPIHAYSYSEYNLATGQEETLFISIEKEIQMGRSVSEQVESKFKLDANYFNQEKVARIGKDIEDVSDRQELIFRFKVLDEEDVENAFALPGGFIYIFKALLEKLEDDEIAAILAHEVGHVCARHGIKRLQSGLGYQILQILVTSGARDSYSRRKAGEAFNQLMLANSRMRWLGCSINLSNGRWRERQAQSVIGIHTLIWQPEGARQTKR